MLGRPTIAWGIAQGNSFVGDTPTPPARRRDVMRPGAPGLADKRLISGQIHARAPEGAGRGVTAATLLEQFRHTFALLAPRLAINVLVGLDVFVCGEIPLSAPDETSTKCCNFVS